LETSYDLEAEKISVSKLPATRGIGKAIALALVEQVNWIGTATSESGAQSM